jgi:hypothetical protein
MISSAGNADLIDAYTPVHHPRQAMKPEAAVIESCP